MGRGLPDFTLEGERTREAEPELVGWILHVLSRTIGQLQRFGVLPIVEQVIDHGGQNQGIRPEPRRVDPVQLGVRGLRNAEFAIQLDQLESPPRVESGYRGSNLRLRCATVQAVTDL
jgi:hypothetical protein